MRNFKKRRVLSPGIWLGLTALIFAAVLVKGQSGRSYSVGLDWWGAGRGVAFPLEEEYDNPAGQVRVLNTQGTIRSEGHPFFEALGANGRACVTCHQPSGAMSVAAERIRQRWTDTHGKDPIFAAVDGSNCPDLPQADPQSHSLLLHKGLFRIHLPWPPRAADGTVIRPEFKIDLVSDPTGCNASTTYGLRSPQPSVSVFRRPRVVANFGNALSEQSGVFTLMTDGREPSLRTQAISAALTHEQANAAPSKEQLDRIVEFEMQIFAAQGAHIHGGLLNERDGPSLLGPENLASGKASLLSGAPESSPSAAGSPSFDIWRSPKSLDFVNSFRASIARGSNLFYTRPFAVPHAVLHNDRLSSASAQPNNATCATCHQAGFNRWMDIGTTDLPDPSASSDLPVFRITCDSAVTAHPTLGRVIYTQDPGRALITGKCADVGSIVMQQMRGLSARGPYFSNGSAQTLGAVVDFYDRRFSIGYSAREKQDLINFLSVL